MCPTVSFFGPSIPPSVSGLDKGAARAAQEAARRKAKQAAAPRRVGDEVELDGDGPATAGGVRRATGNAQEETTQDRREHPGYQQGNPQSPKPGPKPDRPRLDLNG